MQRHSSVPLSSSSTPNVCFDVVHIDIVEPPSQVYNLLTSIDCYTCHPIIHHHLSCCRSSIHRWMDLPIWCSLHYRYQWEAVTLCRLLRIVDEVTSGTIWWLLSTRHEMIPHYLLSGNWNGWMLLSSTESCFEGLTQPRRLDVYSTSSLEHCGVGRFLPFQETGTW